MCYLWLGSWWCGGKSFWRKWETKGRSLECYRGDWRILMKRVVGGTDMNNDEWWKSQMIDETSSTADNGSYHFFDLMPSGPFFSFSLSPHTHTHVHTHNIWYLNAVHAKMGWLTAVLGAACMSEWLMSDLCTLNGYFHRSHTLFHTRLFNMCFIIKGID